MNDKLRLVVIALLLGLVLVPTYAEDTVTSKAETSKEEPSTTTLVGSYLWEQGGETGELTAVFEPRNETSWDVSFHFSFQGRPLVYSGRAKGSLSEGALSGRVRSQDMRRSFSFRGTFKDGIFLGNHTDTTDGGHERTGTLELAAPAE